MKALKGFSGLSHFTEAASDIPQVNDQAMNGWIICILLKQINKFFQLTTIHHLLTEKGNIYVKVEWEIRLFNFRFFNKEAGQIHANIGLLTFFDFGFTKDRTIRILAGPDNHGLRSQLVRLCMAFHSHFRHKNAK